MINNSKEKKMIKSRKVMLILGIAFAPLLALGLVLIYYQIKPILGGVKYTLFEPLGYQYP